MPSAILATLGQWFNDFVLLLDVVKLEKRMDLLEQVARLKTWKHVLQICCNLISRHRKHVDKLYILRDCILLLNEATRDIIQVSCALKNKFCRLLDFIPYIEPQSVFYS
ncbi:hypothetical protein M758_10G049300 [Ceratodon purpureus]|nr:hypothetical protein M758_10G049300 [Ceratodon purpureus]